MLMTDTPGQRELDACQNFFNSQSDVLTAIVKHRTNRRGQLGWLHIATFDPEGKHVTIMIHPPPKEDEIKLELTFNPPIRSPYEARPRLLTWRDQAYAHFDVPKNPAITYYSYPSPFPWLVPILIGIVLLFFAMLGKGQLADWWRSQIEDYLGPYAVRTAALFALITHLGETVWVSYLCQRHRVPTPIAAKWILSVVLVGVAALTEFNECVEYERIRHIYARTDVGAIPPRVGPAPKSKTA